MNRFHRVVWNAVRSCFMVADERAKSRGGSAGSARGAGAFRPLPLAAALSAALASPMAGAVLTSHTPAANQIDVSRTIPVSMVFDTATSLNSGNFHLWGSQTAQYTGSFAGNGTASVSFIHGNSFKPGERVQASYSGAGGQVWEFVAAVSASGTGTFAQSGQTLPAYSAYVAKLGDIDGDGDLDMVLGIMGANRVYKNDGNGNFTDTGQTLGSGTSLSLALGDIDGDGDLDLVEGNLGGANLVWRNDGSGVFTDTGQSLDSSNTQSVALADLDGDGDLDLLEGVNGVSKVWFNDGSGVFSDSGQSLGNAFTIGIALGDVDGDGDIDLIKTVANGIGARVWFNNGGGTFTDSGQSLASGYAIVADLGDVDGDGDLDLAIGNFGHPDKIWLNNGSGTFTDSGQSLDSSQTYSVAFGDIDGDGDLDLVQGNKDQPNRIWLNNGSGVFADTGQSLGNTTTRSVALGDLDGDGDLDIAEASFLGPQKFWINQYDPMPVAGVNLVVPPMNHALNVAAGTNVAVAFPAVMAGGIYSSSSFIVSGSESGIHAGSFSANGTTLSFDPTMDFKPGETVTVQLTTGLVAVGGRPLAAGMNLQFTVAATGGSGRFADSGQTLGITPYTQVAVLGDVDGDGDLDTVFGTANHTNQVWLNNGSGVFADSGQSLGNTDTRSLALGDLDRDGDLDLVVSDSGANLVWLNDGSGVFADSGQSLGNHRTLALALGDVDGDGDLDLIEGDYNQPNRVWLNNGSGVFTDSGQSLGNATTRNIALGDVDNDGDLDLIEGTAGADRVWLNNGSGVFADSGQSLGDHLSLSLALGDVDGDGDLDLVSRGYGQAYQVWLNNGSGVFSAGEQSLGSHTVGAVALGDVDGDGDLDLVEGQDGTPSRVWLNNGSGSFTGTGQTFGSDQTLSVALGDVDGDGDLDAVFGNLALSNRVWINQAILNGSCGSANSVAVVTAPATGLCTAGVAGSVASNAADFTWNCAGQYGGSTASCSAPRQYTVTASSGSGGSLSPTSANVVYGATTTFGVSPNSGYQIGSVSGCGGSLSGSTYTTGNVVADCTVAASFAATGGGSNGGGLSNTNMPTGGGAVKVEGSGRTIVVFDNGSQGSTITMAAGSESRVDLPGTGTVNVASGGASRLMVEKVVLGGQNAYALAVVGGSATISATQAGQAIVTAGGIVAVSGRAGNGTIATADAQGNTTIQAATGDSVVAMSDASGAGVTLVLVPGNSVNMLMGGQSTRFTPLNGGAAIAFDIVVVNSVPMPVPRVVSGDVQIAASEPCAPMLAVDATLVSADSRDVQSTAVQGDGRTTVTLGAGQGMVGACAAGNGLSDESKLIYAGESAEFVPGGAMQRIRLGSSQGNQGWLGDSLSLAAFGDDTLLKASPVGIVGISSRLKQDLASAFLGTINQDTGNTWLYYNGGQDASTGVWTLLARKSQGTGDRLAAWPIGDIVVEPGPDGIRTSGNGLIQVRTGNLLGTFAPALVDPQGFAAEVARNGATQLIVQTDGTLHVLFGNQVYVVQPDWEVLPGHCEGFAADGQGHITWTDAAGNSQVLEPAFADLGQLVTTFQAEDPGLVLQYAWRGEVGVVFGGVSMILIPDPLMVPTPEAHKREAWWMEGSKAYIRYPSYQYNGWSDFTQGFTVRLP